MTRINLVRSTVSQINNSTQDSIAWGKLNLGPIARPLVFAAVLIVCSLAVGCTSEKPKTEAVTSQPTQPAQPTVAAPVGTPEPVMQAEAKPEPVHRTVRRAPATVAYADKSSGLSFQYPRKFALKTGDAADKLVSSDPVPMDFVQPGGVVIAAVKVPESAYPKSDLSSAFFDVSVNKSSTAKQCGEFLAAQEKVSQVNPAGSVDPSAETGSGPADTLKSSKLMIGNMELQSNKTVASSGTGQESSKYFHVYENGSCYEFAMKVSTTSETDEGGKHVDRDAVFHRLEKILATVKISPVAAPEVTASDTSAPSASATPAQ